MYRVWSGHQKQNFPTDVKRGQPGKVTVTPFRNKRKPSNSMRPKLPISTFQVSAASSTRASPRSLKHRRGSTSRFLKLYLRTWLHLGIVRTPVQSSYPHAMTDSALPNTRILMFHHDHAHPHAAWTHAQILQLPAHDEEESPLLSSPHRPKPHFFL